MNDKLIRVFFDSSLTSKTELFELIAEQANPEKRQNCTNYCKTVKLWAAH